jgi:Icc protein
MRDALRTLSLELQNPTGGQAATRLSSPKSSATQDRTGGPAAGANQDRTGGPAAGANQDRTGGPAAGANQDRTGGQPAGANQDGIDRRGMLKCMAWVGTGLVWGMSGGVATSRLLGQTGTAKSSLSFVQISDSHLGFARSPNKDVAGTLKETIARINALPERPAFVLHTGDLTHSANPGEFDAVAELLKEVKTGHLLFVPGEHDFDTDGNNEYLKRYGRGTTGSGWYSFNTQGVHFIGLVNVATPKSGSKDGGLGVIGREQLLWLQKDVAGLSDSTPIVLFAHVPLWTVYENWGWGTRDSAHALALLKRFGSVTVLNGHIHQVMQKVEGNVTFHTARSTAFPQSQPGKGTPGPMRNLPAEKLKSTLGLTAVSYVENAGSLAIVDSTIE